MDIARFKKMPVMGILRGADPDIAGELAAALEPSGLETIEIAMNSEDACRSIRKAKDASRNRLMVGAGTVLDITSLKLALDAGATFIVTPVLIEDVVEYCVKNVIPVFPGALTPAEIYSAWNAGATMVKVFPSAVFGPEYFKEIKAPFEKVELLACGGVSAANVRQYFKNGASAVAFGAGVFKKELLKKRDFANIARAVKGLTAEVRSAMRRGPE